MPLFLLFCLLAPQPEVAIYVPTILDRNLNRQFGRSSQIVQKIYAQIGVRTTWHLGGAIPPRCEKQPGRRQIVFALQERVAGRGPDALAYALPYADTGACITLLVDRLKQRAERNPDSTAALLGHVLAHEIGHVLQGLERHSDTGVMKARWSLAEVAAMSGKLLQFSSHDAELILAPFGNPGDNWKAPE